MDFADPYNGWELLESFADSPSGLWLAEHAWEYGFALSYPRDGEEITGYIYEPWHHRFIGVEAAAAWRDSGLTLIEFLEDLNAKAEAAARRRALGGLVGPTSMPPVDVEREPVMKRARPSAGRAA